MKRNNGGRGPISVADCVKGEECCLFEHVRGSNEWMLKVVAGNLPLGEKKFEYRKRVKKERGERLKEIRLHCKFFNDVKDVTNESSWQWFPGGYMETSTEAYVFATQEQGLLPRFLRAEFEKEDVSHLRGTSDLWEEGGKKVGHLVSGYSGLAQIEYKRRHDQMWLRVYV